MQDTKIISIPNLAKLVNDFCEEEQKDIPVLTKFLGYVTIKTGEELFRITRKIDK